MDPSAPCRKTPIFQTICTVLIVVVVPGVFGGLLLLIIASILLHGLFPTREPIVASDRMEIMQLEMALQVFKEKFGQYPPDFGEETNEQKVAAVKKFLKKAFPKCPESNYPAAFQSAKKFDAKRYNPGTALVFWLGGMQNADGSLIGFSANPEDPFNPDTKARIKPFFDFDPARLDKNRGGIRFYPPSHRSDRSQGCYVYFRAENGTYAGKTYAEAGNSGAMQNAERCTGDKIEYMNPNTFQIRSFGLDGRWGPTPETRWGVLFPTADDFNPENYDDMGNFCSRTFEDSIP
jgi:hypothetical protein